MEPKPMFYASLLTVFETEQLRCLDCTLNINSTARLVSIARFAAGVIVDIKADLVSGATPSV